jgi:hypothetical protein
MKKIKHLLALSLAGVTLTGCNTITEVGSINGVNVATHTKRGFWSPSITTEYNYVTNRPGEIWQVNHASSPGLVGQVAGAAGIAGGAALLRPSRTNVSNSSNNDSTSSNVGHDVATGSVTVNNLPATPSGHPNSPGNGGQPGNGGVNNPNN